MTSNLTVLYLLLLHTIFATSSAEQRDLMLQARCAAKCGNKGGRECKEKCWKEPFEKAGHCGNSTDPFYNSCLTECNSDSNCTSLDKCCTHQCGKTCQPPVGLLDIPGLPVIPQNVTLQISNMRNVMIDWKHPGNSQFVIELREENGPWFAAHKGPRAVHPLRLASIRPGVKYNARVAAVNQLGSRGFSKPSNTIILRLEKKPPDVPMGLAFRGSLKNGSIAGLLTWSPRRPDQYITKYIVKWSQRFFVEAAPRDKGSLEVHRKIVPQSKSCIRIKKLHPNSTYTFSVQAQAIFGKQKLLSNEAVLTVNTTGYSSISKRGARQKPKHFRIYDKVIYNKNGGVNVKISWPVHEPTKYSVTWETDCDSKSISIVITSSNYIIPDVKKNCLYHVFIREKSECKKRKKLGKHTFKVT